MTNDAWLTTFTGTQFFPANPNMHDIHIIDIAHSLSNLCRYGGHCRVHYSVAEHSVRLSDVAPDHLKLAALMHDTPEACLGIDMPSLIKHNLFPGIAAVEEKLRVLIFRKFNIEADQAALDEVKKLEHSLTAAEARDLLPSPLIGWYLPEPPLEAHIDPWPATLAERLFLSKFGELYHG